MEIKKNLEGSTLTLELSGRLDTTTSPALEAEISNLADISKLILDFAGLEYISSAGLRVLLTAQKSIHSHGEMIIRNVCESIAEVFEITGFSSILTIE